MPWPQRATPGPSNFSAEMNEWGYQYDQITVFFRFGLDYRLVTARCGA